MNDAQELRYSRHLLLDDWPEAAQERLLASHAVVIGAGGLGAPALLYLASAGVGRITVVDPDTVELSNLQRQILFDEQDVAEHLPKAIAAERRLKRINSEVLIEPIVADVDCRNLPRLAADMSLMLDGTDNFEVRYLLNDMALESGRPWIFTGCTGSHGQVMPILPGQTACLRCLLPSPPPPGSVETCDTAGVLGPAVSVAAALQAALAIRILTGHSAEIGCQLTVLDVWNGTFRQVDTSQLQAAGTCPACHHGERLWLSGSQRAASEGKP